jgi:hypothetical protein
VFIPWVLAEVLDELPAIIFRVELLRPANLYNFLFASLDTSSLRMDTIGSSKTLVNTTSIPWRKNPEDPLNHCQCEDLKFHIPYLLKCHTSPHMGELRNACNILVEKPEGKRPL